MYQTIFKRYEKKYFLNREQYDGLVNIMTYNAVRDRFFKSTVCSTYYDTPDSRLIRASLEKPVYKEKLRVRSYGIPGKDENCFLELKKKYKGVVYKRRVPATYTDILSYLEGESERLPESQIKSEMDYFLEFYGELSPMMNIFYDRISFTDRTDSQVRFTIDSNILYRDSDLDLRNGIYGNSLLDKNTFLLEVKSAGAMPIWASEMLDELKIYPTAFSKYGTAYTKTSGFRIRRTEKEPDSGNLKLIKGGIYCA